MIRAILLIVFSALAAACSSTGDEYSRAPSAGAGGSAAAGASVASVDAQYFRDIAQANLAEIATGRLAVAKAQSPDVRQFGQRMIDEHTQMQAEGAAIARAKGLPVPAEPDARHQAAAKQLEALSGASFDREYMEQMVKDHVETLQLLEQAYARMKDQDLRAHAQKGIPHVRQHLDAARRIAGDLVG